MLDGRSYLTVGSLALLLTETACSNPSAGQTDTSESSSEGTATSGSETDETAETGEPVCGNGVVEVGENCDDEGESATCDIDCTPVTCGDGLLNQSAGEACDGEELGGETCESLGFDTGTLTCGAGCVLDDSECYVLPAAPELHLELSQIKLFEFSWAAVAEAEYYELLESPAPGEPFTLIAGDITGESLSIEMPLHLRFAASYVLRACNEGGCSDSATVDVMGSLAQAVGYVKASNPEEYDRFGLSMALSGDGNTLAVGAPNEDSNATGIGGNQADNSSPSAGAVYIFVRDGVGTWSQHAYVKASNLDNLDLFGFSMALSADGRTLVVSSFAEDSDATGIDGDQADDSAQDSGAVYVFVRDDADAWSQQAYLKASNTDAGDNFGQSVALSGDGNTLAVGAHNEDGNAVGIGGDSADDSAPQSGAAYVFVRSGMGAWSQQAYVKASNTDPSDHFGRSVALSEDGNTLAVGADYESSSATGSNGNQADNSAQQSGAVYVFTRSGIGAWSQHAYVKASNTGGSDHFGHSVAVSGDGSTLAVGAPIESSNDTGVNGDQLDNSAPWAGAAYVFVRDGMDAWSQQAYVKASNTSADDWFGWSVSLSGDGSELAVGAYYEDSNAIGINGDQADDSGTQSGAVYVFVRDGSSEWSQWAYVKAPNSDAGDAYGSIVALSEDGDTLAVVAPAERSLATGVGGDQADNSGLGAGAVYLY